MYDYPEIGNADVVAIDTETTGLEWFRNHRPFGIAITAKIGEKMNDYYWDIRQEPEVLEWLKVMIKEWEENGKTKVVNHNLKFDIHMLRTVGIELQDFPWDRLHDTSIMSPLLDEHRHSYSLDNLAKDYLGEKKIDDIYPALANLFGGPATRKAQITNLHKAPVDLVAPYAKKDTNLAVRLFLELDKKLENGGLSEVYELERRLFPCIIDMEWQGIRIDKEAAHKAAWELEQRIDIMRRELDELAGFEVNPNPSGSLHKLFAPYSKNAGTEEKPKLRWYSKHGIPLETTGAGKASLGKEALKEMSKVDKCAELVLKCRKLMKAKGTFIEGHILGNAVERDGDWWVHPNINQTKGDDGGTGTGRLSYTQPALQQIPARDIEIAEIVRPIFLPDPGQKWSYADAEQQEFRVFAHYANTPSIIKGYKEDVYMDMHQMVADLTGLPRKAPESGGANAKQVNLGMVFNMGAGELASQMGLPYTIEEVDFGDGPRELKKAGQEAIDVMENYYSKVSGVREMGKKARSVAKSRGYVRTHWGRHIRFPRGQFTHKASGLVYQGSSADLMKINIIRTFDYFKSRPDVKARLLLVIHDEENISMPDMPPEETAEFLHGLKMAMQDFPSLRVPIVYDWSAPADNWWGANTNKEVTNGWEKPEGKWYGSKV